LNVSGALIRTPRHEELCDLIDTNNLSFVCLDLIPDFFDGNENVRNEVNRFVKGILGGIASRHNCAINFLYHPSRSGLADGSGLSGSTAWEGSVRSRLYLSGEDENGIRVLDRKKSNYSGKNSGFNLKWHEGAMVATDEERRPDKKGKPLGEYATTALDALNNIYKGVPVSLDNWRDQFGTIYQQRNGRAITAENWRSARAQLGKRGLVDEVEGRAFPRDE
jgi:hypothetical protein